MKKILMTILAIAGIGFGSLQLLKADAKANDPACCPAYGTERCQPPATCCCK